MVWRMGKFLNSRWWVGVFDAFWRVSWWGIRPSKLPTYPGIWPNFSKKSNAWRLAWGKHGLFWSRSSQNADYRLLQTIVFTTQSERDKNSPTDCFLTLKTMVCMIQSAVCILYSPVLEWTGTLVRKCVHKQSYINYRNDSLHEISTNSGKPTFDIFSFTTSGPTDNKLCKRNDCELASRYWRRTFLYMRMSQTTTDNSQMLSRLSHVDEVQYKRWNHYKVHQALKTWVTFRRHLEFSPWSQVSLKEGCLGEGGWGGEGLERQGEVVGISLNGGRFESFGFFCFAFVFFVFFLFWFLL